MSKRNEELTGDGEWHPTPAELIGLLESDDDDSEPARRVREHVTRCRRCHALQAEAVRSLSEWKWSRGAAEVPAEWLEEVRSAPAAGALPTPPAHVATQRRPSAARWLIAAGVAVALIPVAMMVSRQRNAGWIEPVSSAVAAASRQGMVLTPNPAAPTAPERGATSGAEVDRALDRLSREHGANPGGEETAYWLAAGMLATGDPNAGRLLEDLVPRFADSARLANLEPVHFYRGGRVEDADRALQRILARWPEDRVALFNRALLLKAEGRNAELDAMVPALERAFAGADNLSHRFRSEFPTSTR